MLNYKQPLELSAEFEVQYGNNYITEPEQTNSD